MRASPVPGLCRGHAVLQMREGELVRARVATSHMVVDLLPGSSDGVGEVFLERGVVEAYVVLVHNSNNKHNCQSRAIIVAVDQG